MNQQENQDQQGAASPDYTIPGEMSAFVPPILPPWNGKCRTSEEYVKLIKSFYKLLRLKDVMVNGNNHQILNIKFMGQPGQSLAGIKQATADLANIKPNITGLHCLFQTIMRGSIDFHVSHIASTCVQSFESQNVNGKLVETVGNEADNQLEPEYLYILLVHRFIPKCQKSLSFIHKKARMAIEFYYQVEHLRDDIAKLKNDFQLMLTSLANRASVNSLLQHVMNNKKKAMTELKEYCSFWDSQAYQDTLSIFEERLSVFGTIHFDETDAPGDNLTTWIQHKTIYSHLVKAPEIKPETIAIFKTITEEIAPIIDGVRSFNPSPLEQAQEKAVYMRNSVLRIKRDAQLFLSSESEKTKGKGTSLLDKIKSIRTVIDSLELSGLVVNHDTVGITQDELEEFYVHISNILAEKEHQLKIDEEKQKAVNQELAKGAPELQLPPLNGFSSWLNFRKAINEIMPLHNNPLIKKQILLKGLKNKEDLSRCQSMDYEEAFKYLVQRYESSALIPGLIDELLKLTPASSDKQAYENLTQLISTTSMLQSYQQMDKLDSNCRSKLVFILLHREFQLDFLKEQVIYEESIKKEVAEDRMLDGISEITCLQTAEVEAKRRTWWLEQMGRYLIVARELTKTLKEKKEKSQSLAFSTGSEDVVDPPVETVEACPVCNDVHLVMGKCMVSLAKCPIFTNKDYSVEKRREVVKRYNFCIRCLWKNNNPRCANCTPIPHWLLKEKYQDSAESNEEDSEADNHDSEKSKSNSEQSGEEDEE